MANNLLEKSGYAFDHDLVRWQFIDVGVANCSSSINDCAHESLVDKKLSSESVYIAEVR